MWVPFSCIITISSPVQPGEPTEVPSAWLNVLAQKRWKVGVRSSHFGHLLIWFLWDFLVHFWVISCELSSVLTPSLSFANNRNWLKTSLRWLKNTVFSHLTDSFFLVRGRNQSSFRCELIQGLSDVMKTEFLSILLLCTLCWPHFWQDFFQWLLERLHSSKSNGTNKENAFFLVTWAKILRLAWWDKMDWLVSPAYAWLIHLARRRDALMVQA